MNILPLYNYQLSAEQKRLFKTAYILALITVGYNLIEGIVSTWFGYQDETLALFGFGIDSFIETISGIGIVHMILRIKKNPESSRDEFEKTALKITGVSFYLLTAGLAVTAAYNMTTGRHPESTLWGIIISLISIVSMAVLVNYKLKVGRALKSEPILADANCTKVCIYMSIVLLLSSGLYELTKFGYFDSIGTLGLAWYSFKEGKECFEKAQNKACSCCSCSAEKENENRA